MEVEKPFDRSVCMEHGEPLRNQHGLEGPWHVASSEPPGQANQHMQCSKNEKSSLVFRWFQGFPKGT